MISSLINETQGFKHAEFTFHMLLIWGSVESCIFMKGFSKTLGNYRDESGQSTVVVNIVFYFFDWLAC